MNAYSRVERICLTCGASFMVIRRRAQTAKYCSHKCQTFLMTRPCVMCGTPFTFKRKVAKTAKCCSTKCMGAWRTMKSQTDPEWRRRMSECQPKPPDVKACPDCERILPRTTEFFFRHSKPAGGVAGYQSACKECSLARHRQWGKDNPVRRREYDRIKEARRRAAGTVLPDDLRRLFWFQDGRCAYCRDPLGSPYHADHMTPVVRGGTSDPGNLALACPTCNMTKGTKTAEEFLAGLA
jgi:hypothetical protein